MIEPAVAVCVALLADFAFGDPRNRYHPTAWVGCIISRAAPLARNAAPALERAGGAGVVCAAAAAAITAVLAALYAVSLAPPHIMSVMLGAAAAGVLLKTTLAIRGMERHAIAVLAALERGDMAEARARLAMIVKRDTSGLDQNAVISGVVESVGENTVDGVTGPLFYYALFGLPGAFAYRTVNTADSMVGYRSAMFKNVGWFAAKSDTVLNFMPSRLTGMVMVLAAALLGRDWRESYRTMLRDAGRTDSANSGYPMAALAGALGARLAKAGCYQLGRGESALEPRHVRDAISLLKVTSLLFAGMVVVPAALALSYLGWWVYA